MFKKVRKKCAKRLKQPVTLIHVLSESCKTVQNTCTLDNYLSLGYQQYTQADQLSCLDFKEKISLVKNDSDKKTQSISYWQKGQECVYSIDKNHEKLLKFLSFAQRSTSCHDNALPNSCRRFKTPSYFENKTFHFVVKAHNSCENNFYKALAEYKILSHPS